MDPRALSALHRAGRVALAVTAVTGVLCAMLTVLALATGVRPLVFRSGSMSPDVPTGSLGFSRSTAGADVKVGDVVTVTTKTGTKVTHRVVTATYHGSTVTLQLKGDANKTPDADLYQVGSAPRLLFSVPKVGYVVNWLSRAPGSYVLALYVALMLVVVARRKNPDAGSPPLRLNPISRVLAPPIMTEADPAPQPEPRRRGRHRALAVGSALVIAFVALVGFGGSTWASWSDAATVSGSTITSGTWAIPVPVAPVVKTCVRSGNDITLTWTEAVDPTSFQIIYTSPGTEPLIAGTLRTGATSVANFNNSTGTIWIVAINSGGTSPASNKFSYQGNGSGNGTCTAVP
jgi:signal peptidase I